MTLPARQVQVLEMMAEGLPQKTIARELEISLSTLETYMRRTMKQLGAKNGYNCLSIAFRRGIIR